MRMCILIEYSDNYLDISGSLGHFKRNNPPVTNARNLNNVSTTNSTCFKYKSIFFKPLTTDDNRVFKVVKIDVPIKYLAIFGYR